MATTTQNVLDALLELGDYKNAREWIHNDIMKSKIAKGYDAWIKDIEDHKLHLTLSEYITYLLDTPEHFEY